MWHLTAEQRVAAIRTLMRRIGTADPFPELEGASYLAVLSAYRQAERAHQGREASLSSGQLR
jgi:hypothetical protein